MAAGIFTDRVVQAVRAAPAGLAGRVTWGRVDPAAPVAVALVVLALAGRVVPAARMTAGLAALVALVRLPATIPVRLPALETPVAGVRLLALRPAINN